ncbi:MAG: glycosyl transferase [Desulfobacteraceae bacterium]|jgi:UDP-GlcNAc:undecaprenyl-phosphate GlcNAc-1-phosphate transferase
MPHTGIVDLAIAFFSCAILTPLVRWVALQKGWMAAPSQDRWHKKPTALMGGIAIFAAIFGPLIWLSDFGFVRLLISGSEATALPSLSAVILLGASLLFLLGLLDDFRNIKPQSKLVGQIVAAALVTGLGYRLHWFESLTLDTMATLFWVVGITNAFNLIDNMDGLCSGVGMVAATSFAALFYGPSLEAFQVSLIVAGALAGFLIYNFNPAKIFMGDCGSLVIGFSISVLALSFSATSPTTRLATITVPVLVLLVPILDTSLVTVIRLLSGRKASTGGRDHTSHRLVLMGFSERKAVLFLYGVGGLSGLAAIFVSRSDSLTSPAVILPLAVAILLMAVYLSQLRVYPEKEFSALRDRSFTPVLIDLTYKRQLLLIFLDFVIVAFAYYCSYRLRFGGSDFSYYFKMFLKSMPMVIGCKLLIFYLMGVYRGLWSYISTSDVFLIVRASLTASLAAVAAMTYFYRFKDFSKGVFIIDWFLATGFVLAVRGSFRLFLETHKRQTLSGDKVVIYGAGRAGELLLREIVNNPSLNVKPVGFVDDDRLKKGKKIQGYPILGSFESLAQIHQRHRLDGLLISFNDQGGQNAKSGMDAREFCKSHGLFLKRFHVCLIDEELATR